MESTERPGTRFPPPVAVDNAPPPDDGSAVIAVQRRLLEEALARGASDLHIEPRRSRARVRVRVDGRLQELEPLPLWLQEGLVTRFKVLGSMDIAERRRPQDGRASTRVNGAPVDLRIASIASQHGEAVVVRLLPRRRRPPSLVELGLDRTRLDALRSFITRPHGLILASGPTGAGKTTTLYALLQEVDGKGRSVLTLEDPIEYRLDDALQVPVRTDIGLGFAVGLRAALRLDPDVILVGEIRDEETAEVAVRAAMTGHLVLSTLHANGAVESAIRLLDLGVPAYALTSALTGIVAQRLVRRLCPACRRRTGVEASSLRSLGAADDPEVAVYEAVGCDRCDGGFHGRIGIFETLAVDGPVTEVLGRGVAATTLRSTATTEGRLHGLRRSAVDAVVAGDTTVGEALRVIGPSQTRDTG